uniref:Uncharacterized protein LOC101510918 n=1 Tax=Cicer arietinum TaxID=3827 RepID=A0A1S2Z8F9_CICAR|nr:uncharacterized protein LOC101510918 [Cicer arietinum]
MSIQELQGSFEAHEQRMKERSGEKNSEVALQAQSNNKDKRGRGKWRSGKRRNYNNTNARNQQDHNGNRQGGSRNHQRGGNSQKGRGGKKKFDKSNKRESQQDNAKFAHEEQDDEPVMLMVTTKEDEVGTNLWYLDTGCLTHMSGRKDWFINLDESMKSKVKFANSSSLMAEGVGEVLIQNKNGKQSKISEGLFVPGLKCNLLSVGQLLEKGYMMKLEDKQLKVDLKKMNIKGVVKGLPQIQEPTEMCEDCVQSKQHRSHFSKHMEVRSKEKLEVIYSDFVALCKLTQLETIDQLRRKLDDKGEQMVLMGYHATRGYKLYDPINRKIVINRDVLVDEIKEWKWSTE